MTEDEEVAAFQGMCGKLGELWPDYVLIVRARTGRGYRQRTSNGDWCFGVLSRSISEIKARVVKETELEVEKYDE